MRDSSELVQWHHNEISQYLIKNIRDELESAKKELVDGALIVSPALEREYCRAIGEIQAYEKVLKLVDPKEQENDEQHS